MGNAADGIDSLRQGLRTSADPRAERTRSQLFEAAQALCADGRTVSVSAITRQADVSRSVFYTHFGDIGELALRMQQPHIDEIVARSEHERELDPHEAMLVSQRRLVSLFASHRALYRAAFQLPGGQVEAQIEEAIRLPLEAHISSLGGAPDGLRPGLAARYVAAAATRLLEDWVLGEIDADDETIVHHLYALMPQWMHERSPESPPVTRPRKETP